MYVTDKLVYIQMQKTGCSHIAKILSRLFDGRQIGKHNAATVDQIQRARYVISSIRNPWEWYLSLWSYGVEGKGALRGRLTKRDFRGAFIDAVKDPSRGILRIVDELGKDVNRWNAMYGDVDDVKAFRAWLSQIHNPKRVHDLGEGYGRTAIAGFCGFMTYRYLYLCCTEVEELNRASRVSNYSDLLEFEQGHCYIDYFVRQESLEDSLCEILEAIHPLTEDDRQMIFGSARTNSTARRLSSSEYYDQASIELVKCRDRLLIEKFGYRPPEVTVEME